MKNNSKLLTVKETSEFLGIPEWTLRGMVRDRKIPIVRFNRRIMFDKNKLENWIENHSIESIDDFELED